MEKTDDLLQQIYKYYKYSHTHDEKLRAVQEAFGEPEIHKKDAKHHQWSSNNQRVTAVLR